MPEYLWCAPFTDIRILIKIVAKSAMRATRLRFPQKILPNSRGKGISYQSDVTVVPRREFGSAHMTMARKSRGKFAEIPREVKVLAITREVLRNGNQNPSEHTQGMEGNMNSSNLEIQTREKT